MPRIPPQTPSFASVDELKHANIRPFELAVRGKIKVDGNEYQVRLLPSGEYQVNRQDSGKLGFFKATKELFSHRLSEGSLGSRSSAIADVLNGKRTPAEHAGLGIPGWATPQRRPAAAEASTSAPPPYATPPRGGLAQKLASGWHTAKPAEAPASYASSSLQTLTKQMAKEMKKHSVLDHNDIYRRISDNIPKGLQPLDKPQQQAMIRTIANASAHYDGRLQIKSQYTDAGFEYIPYKQTARELPHIAAGSHIRLERTSEKPSTRLDGSALARITINVKPEFAAQLGKAMAHLIAHTPYTGGKLIAPSDQGSRTESAIIYLPPDIENAEAITQKLQTLLPPEAFIEHHTIGMHPMSQGFNYSESSASDDTSHGMARAKIMHEAIKDKGPGTLEQKLLDACERHGYSRENPAFLATSKLPA